NGAVYQRFKVDRTQGPPRQADRSLRWPCQHRFWLWPAFAARRSGSQREATTEKSSAVKVGACRRQAGRAADALRCQRLEDADAAVRECDRGDRQIHHPEPPSRAADLAVGGFAVGADAVMPERRGAGIVLAPGFDVVHLEAVKLQVLDRHADVIERAARKDVAPDIVEHRGFVLERALIFARAQGDRVVQVEAAWLEQAVHGLEIG